MIPGARNAKRPWEPQEEQQLREMAEAGKSITVIALRLKRTVTAVRFSGTRGHRRTGVNGQQERAAEEAASRVDYQSGSP
jgi:DNA-binding NarL/FixJ family response regulator